MARALLYKQAETEMRRRIADGDWPVGMRVGNEFQLADEFKVSQGTMRRALMTLEADGLLDRKPGRGTIVAKPARKPKQAQAAAPGGQLRGPGGTPVRFGIHRAKTNTRPPNAIEAELFGPRSVHVLERLLKVGGNRAALEELVLPGDHGEPEEDLSPDLATAVEELGFGACRIETALSAEMTSMGDSVALACDRNTALLCLTRTAMDGEGRPRARQVLRIADADISYS